MSLRDKILTAQDRPTRAVEVPEWGTTVFIRVMSGLERNAFGQSMSDDKEGNANLYARLLVRTLCDEQGNRIFTDADAGHLGQKSAVVLDRLVDIANEVNGLTPKNIAAIAGNSDANPNASST